jgi:hypothetical protein
MPSGADIAGAIGTGLSTFGKLETSRRGGGSIGEAAVVRQGEKEQEKIEKAVTDTQRALRPKLGEKQSIDMSGAQSLSKGGRIKRTGVYRLHKGEVVVPAKAVKRMEKRKATRKSGRR